MTRGRTSPQKAADTAAHAGRAALVEMLFDSGALRIAIAPFNIPVGADTYVSTTLAFEMSLLSEAEAGFDGMQLKLSGVDSAIQAVMASEPYRGRTVRVLEQRFDADDALVGTAQTQWIGRIRAMGQRTLTTEAKSEIWLQGEHFDAEFAQPQVIRITDADQQRRYPGDLGGEYLASLQDRVLARNR